MFVIPLLEFPLSDLCFSSVLGLTNVCGERLCALSSE